MDTLAGKLSLQTLDKIVAHFGLEEVRGRAAARLWPSMHHRLAMRRPVACVCGMAASDSRSSCTRASLSSRLASIRICCSHSRSAIRSYRRLRLIRCTRRCRPGADPEFPRWRRHVLISPRSGAEVRPGRQSRLHAARLCRPVCSRRPTCLRRTVFIPRSCRRCSAPSCHPGCWRNAPRPRPTKNRCSAWPTTICSTGSGFVDAGLDDLVAEIQGEAGATRDAANRELIFNRDIDAVWAKIDGLLGAEVSDAMIGILRNQKVEAKPPL